VTLGRGFTGAKVAIPIFEPILQATWKHYAPKTALKPPSPALKSQLLALPIDLRSGTRLSGSSGQAFTEYFRLSGSGRQLEDTQYKFVARDEPYRVTESPYDEGDEDWGYSTGRPAPQTATPWWQPGQQGAAPGYYYYQPPMTDPHERYQRRPRNVDPEYDFWRQLY
jgi:hypothetical protein